MTGHRIRVICLFALLNVLTGCDPGVHIAWQKQFDRDIDPACIAKALRSISSAVSLGSYISSGDNGFSKGIKVTQFGYGDPAGRGYYSLNIAKLSTGKTNYYHEWSKLGTDISPNERAEILPLLYKANRAVAHSCGLSFDDIIPEQGDG